MIKKSTLIEYLIIAIALGLLGVGVVYYADKISDVSILDQVIKTQKPYTAINTFRSGITTLTTGYPVFDQSTNELKFAVSVASNISELVSKQKSIISDSKKRSVFPANKFLSKSEKIGYVLNKIDVLTNPNLSILITGETGTGKDFLAKSIHLRLREVNHDDNIQFLFAPLFPSHKPDAISQDDLTSADYGLTS